MKITRREDFSLILMSVLARNYKNTYISLTQIARESNMSPLFLKHIATTLLNKKLIISKEGIGGGYKLVRDPKKILLSSVLSASSPGIIAPYCAHGKNCKVKKEVCNCRELWEKVEKHIFAYLEKINLAEFAKI